MRILAQSMCVAAGLAISGSSQTFEVASLRVAESGQQEKRNGPNIDAKPGTLTMRSVGINDMIMWSYKISPYQVTNAPPRDGDRYDLLAKAAGPAKPDEMRLMLQALLAERFKMASHRETKEVSAFVLVEAKGGHKLKESGIDGQGVAPIEDNKRMALAGQGTTLDQLAMFLSGPLRCPVVDMTGLKGRFDFEFDITNYRPKERVDGEPPTEPIAILQDALPKQLGLKLEGRKMPISMLVIDHLEKAPVGN